MKFRQLILISLILTILGSCGTTNPEANTPGQREINRISMMPDFPQPYKMLDWNQITKEFDSLVYSFDTEGEFWPMIWLDDTRKNLDQETFGIFTSMGDIRQGKMVNDGMFHESLNSLGSLLGATLVGIDKSDQDGFNFVEMVQNYFNTENGWNIIMNNTGPEVALLGGGYGRDWWYDVYPNVLFYGLADFYPEVGITEKIQRSVAEQFFRADSILDGNYDFSFFDYAAMEGKTSWITSQEDAAAGHAYVLYCAYRKFGYRRYLEGAISSLSAITELEENRFYEILMPFGAYVAARLNAEEGTDIDPAIFVNWSFEPAVGRSGWGVLAAEWNGYDVSGLVGSITHNDGYGFLMNTFDMAWPLVPMVRYDPSFANAIGKWMLNAANAARLMYPAEIPAEHQTLPQLTEETKGVIAYEGIIHHSDYDYAKELKAPIAQGDGPNWIENNPDASQFSIYGSGHVGIFGGIISETNIEGILQLDLLATDFYRDEAYPSYLYYNPHSVVKNIQLPKLDGSVYNMITKEIITDNTEFISVAPGESVVVVLTPKDGVLEIEGDVLKINDIIVDYNYRLR